MTVFVSYSSRDRDAVKSLTQDLQDADEQVWMDQRLAGGEAWWRAILDQIRGCDVFIFALSQSSLDSKPCQAELQYAQALGLPILPVQVGLVDSMQLNPLASVQAIDYRHATPGTAMRLSAALHRERARRQPLPDPLPDEPSVPFEYLIRLYNTISNPDYLTPRDQAALVAQLQVSLREDGQHEAARNDIVTLLRKLHDREDVTYRTRTDVEAILASVQAESAPIAFAGPPVSTPQRANTQHPYGWAETMPAPSRPPPRQPLSRRTKIWTAVGTVVVVAAVIVGIVVGTQSPSRPHGSAGGVAGTESSSAPSSGTQSSSVTGGAVTPGSPPSSGAELLSVVPSADHCTLRGPDETVGAQFTVYCDPGLSEVRMLRYSVLSPSRDLDSQISDDAPEMWQKPCVGHQGIQNWSAGKFVCYNRGEYPYIEWTINSRRMLALMGGPAGGSLDEVYQWWAARYQ
ncbi:MAG: toll/interleukin-1 receptor domain-containing protein [Mycobacterium sp.]|uniref:toll/interleukin-1 receptor domain-containing protein n=1 Tax=Mycobacterium sp. TaxID=1785 RepID=UPI003C318FC1